MRQIKTFIAIPIYNYRIFVIFTDDLKACVEQLKKDGLLATNAHLDDTAAFTIKYSNQSYTYLVYPLNACIGNIVHEVYHAVSNMFNWIDAKPDEEVMAYSIGYVTGEVIKDQSSAIKKIAKELDKAKEI